jgi:prepilin signal peptidase PulO-like enzyme (type II secretory pathway)
MHIYFTFITYILGLVLASFLNALLYRIDNGYKYPDIFIKGSHCEKCGKLLKTYELIPVLSFFIFKGKCSVCGYRVPLYYPVSEFFLGIGLASIYYYSLPHILYFVLISLFVFSYFDRIYKGVPKVLINVFLGILSLYFVAMSVIQNGIPDNSILISLGIVLFIFILTKIMHKPFGLGDLLVLIGLGLVLDIRLYITYIYVFLFLSTGYALVRILLKKATLKTAIPLLPFIYISFSILLLIHRYVFEYLKIFYIF